MRPDYKNWAPKGMVSGFFIGSALALALFIVFGCLPIIQNGTVKTILFIVLLLLTCIMLAASLWLLYLHNAFSYTGKRQIARKIIERVAEHVTVPEGGSCLDVGCGSGALEIACAKRNPKASFVGIDRWGKEYASFNKPLCESNARAEGVTNATFLRGDATRLDFADGTFDVVTSNYVYHNIPGDRQAYLLETLRTLKKGGTFAIHDIMTPSRYGNMDAFLVKLRSMGYEEVRLIDVTEGIFSSKLEAAFMDLAGSKLLVGRK